MPHKNTKVIHWQDMGIFPGTVMFACGFTFDEIISRLKKSKATKWRVGLAPHKAFVEGSNYCYIKSYIDVNGKEEILYYVIVKAPFQFTDREYCKLAHEVLHICQVHLPDLLNRDQEKEAEAYLHTYLMENFLKVLRT